MTLDEIAAQTRGLAEPFVIMGVGIPGSGKTTRLTVLAATLGVPRICPDDIYDELSGLAADQRDSKSAWTEAYFRTAERLRGGNSLIFDAPYCGNWPRQRDAAHYRNWGAATIIAVVFDTPLHVALKRNAARARHTPVDVIRRMHSRLEKERPRRSEGLDHIYSIEP